MQADRPLCPAWSATERLLKAIPGLKGVDILTKEQMQRKVVAAKRLLWHGRKNDCLAALEVLRRDREV